MREYTRYSIVYIYKISHLLNIYVTQIPVKGCRFLVKNTVYSVGVKLF